MPIKAESALRPLNVDVKGTLRMTLEEKIALGSSACCGVIIAIIRCYSAEGADYNPTRRPVAYKLSLS
jgi:hypothetical protein